MPYQNGTKTAYGKGAKKKEPTTTKTSVVVKNKVKCMCGCGGQYGLRNEETDQEKTN